MMPDDSVSGAATLKILQKCGRNPFVDEHSAMLRIVAKLYDVEMPVVCFQQMRLRATTHFGISRDSVDRHERGSNLSQEELNDECQKKTPSPAGPTRTKDEVALELMKFVAVTTGYGKGSGGAGYGSKATRTAEEYAGCAARTI